MHRDRPTATTRPDDATGEVVTPDGVDRVRYALVAALIAVIPFAIRYLLLVEVHSPHIERPLLKASTFGPLELMMILVAVAASPLLLRRSTYRSRPLGLLGAMAFAGVTIVWLLIDPSPEGVLRAIRLAGIVGTIAIISTMSVRTFRLAVVWPLAASAALQATWALLQTHVWRNGHHSGITSRWAHAWTQGYGSMDGAYALAAFLVLAIAVILASGAFGRLHPLMWGSVVVSSFAVSVTFGRSGVLALLAIGGLYGIAWLVSRDWRDLASSLSASVPMLVGIAIAWTGWSVRANETLQGKQFGRESLLDRAFTVIGSHPLVGVGPGNYAPTLARIGVTSTDITIVHNIPVLVAAEYGIPIGVLFTVWLVALGIVACMTSMRAVTVFVAIVPYLVFDHPHLAYAYGIAEFGIWLAVLDFHRRAKLDPHEETDGRPSHDDVLPVPAPA